MTLSQRLKVVNNTYISYPRFDEILNAIEYCHYFSSCKDEPECLFLSGHTGVGQTTIYHTYASKYPQYITSDRTVIPILAVTIPSPATVKAVVSKLLWQLGDPAYEKGSIGKQTIRLIGLIRDCGVQLIILIEEKIPTDPKASHFALRKPLDKYSRLKKMGLPSCYRLFFKVFPQQKVIIILWLGFPRKEGIDYSHR